MTPVGWLDHNLKMRLQVGPHFKMQREKGHTR